MQVNDHEDDFADTESTFSAELSPADGYFSPRDLPQYYRNAQPGEHGHEKRQDAASEAQNVSHYRSHHNGASETTSLLRGDLIPPAYEDITGKQYPAQVTNQRAQQQLVDPPWFRAVPEVQSMMDYRAIDDGQYERYATSTHRRKRNTPRRLITRAFWIISLTTLLLLAAGRFSWWGSSGTMRDEGGCNRITTDTLEYAFDTVSSFNFIEKIDLKRYSAGVRGAVKVLDAPSHQNAQIVIVVSLLDDEHIDMPPLLACRGDESVTIKLDDSIPNRQPERSGGGMWNPTPIHVRALLAPNLTLHDLNIDTTVLSPLLEGFETMTVKGVADIRTTVGAEVSCSDRFQLNSRNTRITTGTGRITGDWNLEDELTMETTTGQIDVDINPKEALRSDPKPARFSARTGTGSIAVEYPIYGASKLPERDYDIAVSSKTGSVSGRFLVDRMTRLSSGTGPIEADVLVYDAKRDSALTTLAGTGHTEVRVLPSYKDADDDITRLKSDHTSRTGPIALTYPGQWYGHIAGSSGTGSVKVSGKGVKIIKQTRLHRKIWEHGQVWLSRARRGDRREAHKDVGAFLGHSIEAQKGDEDVEGRIGFQSSTGSVTLDFSDI